MTTESEQLKQWIANIASLMGNNGDPEPQHYLPFLQDPKLALRLIDMFEQLDENALDEEHSYYSAFVFALDICVAQLQAAQENKNKSAKEILTKLMDHMANIIQKSHHSLSFWLPVLNAFYEVHVELSPALKEAYLLLAEQEEALAPEDEAMHLNTISDIIADLSDLSPYDITENFFAQSYAMPPEFFADLVIDLYSIEQGQDIALLLLLHPQAEVRDIVVQAIEQIIDTIKFSSRSLSRLRVISTWYPASYQDQFNHWIKQQRKKGVVFEKEAAQSPFSIKATEVDGSGAQGLFIHLKIKRKNRLLGLLIKKDMGIKDAWCTTAMSAKEISNYYSEAFDENVTLREVDQDYLLLIANHFLAVTLQQGNIPDLHFLEIQELLGLHFTPQLMDIPALMDELAIQISPFTQETISASLKRSRSWLHHEKFTESWYEENPHVDKIVNRFCSFVEGVKVCNIENAIHAVFEQEIEQHRDKWLFHFLWIALWMKAKGRKNEKNWQHSFFIAYLIQQGEPLKNIPVMQEICRQTVINSVETMNERRTYLT